MIHQHSRVIRFRIFLLLIPFFLPACSPSLSPLYRDYGIQTEADLIYDNIRESLVEAGWQETTSSALNVIVTEEKTLSRWGIYRVVASLEIVPIGNEYVRVFVNPYRRFFTGSRSKIPFLPPTLKRKTLSDITRAMEKRGLILIGNPIENDRKARRRRNP